MNDKDLISAIERLERMAEKYGDLSDERAKALNYYKGEPFGNEMDDRSQVVSRDVHDHIEAVKAPLLKIFVSGDEVVKFDPRGPEDEEQAQQETDYINLQIERANGYEIAYNWATDGLLQKTGYVKAYWDDSKQVEEEKYEGLSQEELAMVASDSDVEIVEQEEYPDPLMGVCYNVTLKRTKTEGRIALCNIPPEQVLVDHNATSVRPCKANFFEHWEYKTISELRAEGFDVPDDLNDASSQANEGEWESDERDEFQPFRDKEGEYGDPSLRRVKVREIWARIDFDGDGIAELRHVIAVGTTILENESAELIPVAAWSPNPLPHQHFGESMADDLMDVQFIKSMLLRGELDNTYLSINGRNAVDTSRVNLDDLLTVKPGGVVRVKGSPGDAIMPLVQPNGGGIGLNMAQYFDNVAQGRTGIQKVMPQNPGDANALNKTAFGLSVQQSANMARVELMARTWAETGWKDLFKVVHYLALTHNRKAEVIRLRNTWVTVNPREWSRRDNLKISVGLGTGSRETQMQFLMSFIGLQMQLSQIGIVEPRHIYNTVSKIVNAIGFKNPTEFAKDPTNEPPPQPQGPPPEVMLKMQELQQKGQMDQQKMQLDQARMQMDAQNAEAERQLKLYIAQLQSQTQEVIAQMKAVIDEQSQMVNAQANETRAEIDRVKLQLDVLDKMQGQKETTVNVNGEEIKKANGETKEVMGQGLAQLAQAVASLQESVNRPKQVIRDQSGRVVGVQ
jgi:hypothetical protein